MPEFLCEEGQERGPITVYHTENKTGLQGRLASTSGGETAYQEKDDYFPPSGVNTSNLTLINPCFYVTLLFMMVFRLQGAAGRLMTGY